MSVMVLLIFQVMLYPGWQHPAVTVAAAMVVLILVVMHNMVNPEQLVVVVMHTQMLVGKHNQLVVDRSLQMVMDRFTGDPWTRMTTWMENLSTLTQIMMTILETLVNGTKSGIL